MMIWENPVVDSTSGCVGVLVLFEACMHACMLCFSSQGLIGTDSLAAVGSGGCVPPTGNEIAHS